MQNGQSNYDNWIRRSVYMQKGRDPMGLSCINTNSLGAPCSLWIPSSKRTCYGEKNDRKISRTLLPYSAKGRELFMLKFDRNSGKVGIL